MEHLIAGIIGLITGALGSLIAPWMNWGIEKKRLLRQARKDLLERAYREINENLSREEFADSDLYARLSPYLSEDTRKRIHRSTTVVEVRNNGPSKVNPYVKQVLVDLHRLEREWELI